MRKVLRTVEHLLKPIIGNEGIARIGTLISLHRLLRLKAPRTYSDLIQRRMLYDKSPDLAWTCDKCAMKEHAKAMNVRVPQTLWFGETLDSLIGVTLTGQWVAKPNNSSGLVYFGSSSPDAAMVVEIKKKIGSGLNPYNDLGQWAYSQAKKGFLIEALLGNPPIPDYKVFVFHGYAVCIDVHLNRYQSKQRTTFNRTWQQVGVPLYADSMVLDIPRPECLEAMIDDAERIASAFDFMRVDFYVTEETYYFGETTPYPGAGRTLLNREFDTFLGNLWLSGSKQSVIDLYPKMEQFLL